MDRADAVLAQYTDLSALSPARKASIRAYLLKVVQEYARHNGHADILRDRIDGSRGE